VKNACDLILIMRFLGIKDFDVGLLACNAVWLCGLIPVFQRTILLAFRAPASVTITGKL
jgi:hypothetical protein